MQNNKTFLKQKIFFKLLSILPFVFWVLIILGFDTPYIGICTILAAIIHELGHIAAAKLISKEFSLSAVLSGFRIRGNKLLSYKEEAVIAAAGPLINLIVFLLLFFIFNNENGYISVFAALNLFTALSNLLPIRGYDGYRILACLFRIFGHSEIPFIFLRCISFLFITLFSFISLYFMAKFDGGYWIYFIFLSALIKTILNDQKTKNEKTRDFKRF